MALIDGVVVETELNETPCCMIRYRYTSTIDEKTNDPARSFGVLLVGIMAPTSLDRQSAHATVATVVRVSQSVGLVL